MKRFLKRVLKKIENFFIYLEKSKLTLRSWLIAFFAINLMAFLLEIILDDLLKLEEKDFFNSFLFAYFLFNLVAYLMIIFWLKVFTKEKLKKINKVLIWLSLFVIIRPLIDVIILGDVFYQPFFILSGSKELLIKFLTFFGKTGLVGVMYGTKIEVALLLIILFFYSLYKKKNKITALFLGILIYSSFFIIIAIPSVWSILIKITKGEIVTHASEVATIFFSHLSAFSLVSPSVKIIVFYKTGLFYGVMTFFLLIALQYLENKVKFFTLIKNIRFPQLLLHLGLFTLGMGTAFYYYPEEVSFNVFSILVLINLILAIVFAWAYSIASNDLADIKIDKISNKDRPLVKKVLTIEEYENYKLIFLLLALLFSLIVGIKMFSLVLTYCLLSWVYSQEPFRVKRFFLISGLPLVTALFLVYFMGFYLVADNQSLVLFPWKIILFLAGMGFLIIPLKDLKDLKGDKKNKINTLPGLLSEKSARIVLGWIVFFAHLFLVWLLRLPRLFWPAVIFGFLGYQIINQKKIKREKLIWFFLMELFAFGIILIVVLL